MNEPRASLVGKTFGSLTVVEDGLRLRKAKACRCQCACGGSTIAAASMLVNGQWKGCANCRKRKAHDASVVHGDSFAREYFSYRAALGRCTNVNNVGYKRYGGRGISVCQRWMASYQNFLEDMGQRPPGTTLERIDNSGNYEPGNCKWASPIAQANNRRSNRIIEWRGFSRTVSQWARLFNVSQWRMDYLLRKKGLDIPSSAILLGVELM